MTADEANGQHQTFWRGVQGRHPANLFSQPYHQTNQWVLKVELPRAFTLILHTVEECERFADMFYQAHASNEEASISHILAEYERPTP